MSAEKHWSVTVGRGGERVVTIETDCLSGRELVEGDEEAIRTAAHHLLSFIGDGAPTKTYREEFLPGTRVVVRADASEGSDHEFNGRRGTVVEYGKYLAVEFDRPLKHWPNPYLICLHNLRALTAGGRT